MRRASIGLGLGLGLARVRVRVRVRPLVRKRATVFNYFIKPYGNVSPGEECADNDVSCPSWAGQGLCDPARDNGYMSENCRLSCQLCTRELEGVT